MLKTHFQKDLSVADFVAQYELPGRPVIITDLVTQWPAFQKWSFEYLLQHYGDREFIAGPLNISLREFALSVA